jgi:RNA polymerase sigma-70 factor (ECF subfamily)
MDVAEIAAALGIDPQTVRSTHHKAMLKLRDYFAVEGNPDGVGGGPGKLAGRG